MIKELFVGCNRLVEDICMSVVVNSEVFFVTTAQKISFMAFKALPKKVSSEENQTKKNNLCKMMVDLNWEVCKLFASLPSRIPDLKCYWRCWWF